MAANSTTALSRVLMVAALGLAAVGGTVAIVQPGDMGNGSETTTDDVAATDQVPITDDDDTPPATDQATDDDVALPADDPTTTTTATTAPLTTAPTTTGPTTTMPGTDDTANGAVGSEGGTSGLPTTGIESMLALAVLLGGAGWAIGRTRRR